MNDFTQIPDQYQIKKPLIQETYLSDGELIKWQGEYSEIYSTISSTEKYSPTFLGKIPSLGKKEALESLDVDKEKIKFELFTSPVKKVEESIVETLHNDFDGNSKITVICDDEEVEFELNKDGDSILDAAMEKDLDVPFSCKGAVCCTCKAKVIKGKVTMDANYALSDQEVEDGYILSCQAHPATESVTVDFDF